MSRFFAQHFAALRDALRRLVAAPLNTLLSLVVIGSALALPSAGWVMLDNLRALTGSASGVQQISLFTGLNGQQQGVTSRLAQPRRTHRVTACPICTGLAFPLASFYFDMGLGDWGIAGKRIQIQP